MSLKQSFKYVPVVGGFPLKPLIRRLFFSITPYPYSIIAINTKDWLQKRSAVPNKRAWFPVIMQYSLNRLSTNYSYPLTLFLSFCRAFLQYINFAKNTFLRVPWFCEVSLTMQLEVTEDNVLASSVMFREDNSCWHVHVVSWSNIGLHVGPR